MIPTDEELTKLREVIESAASHDEAVRQIVEALGWRPAIAAEWVRVARTGEYDLEGL